MEKEHLSPQKDWLRDPKISNMLGVLIIASLLIVCQEPQKNITQIESSPKPTDQQPHKTPTAEGLTRQEGSVKFDRPRSGIVVAKTLTIRRFASLQETDNDPTLPKIPCGTSVEWTEEYIWTDPRTSRDSVFGVLSQPSSDKKTPKRYIYLATLPGTSPDTITVSVFPTSFEPRSVFNIRQGTNLQDLMTCQFELPRQSSQDR